MKIDRFLSQDDAAALSRLAEQLMRVREVKYNEADKLIELIAMSILLPANDPRVDYVTLNSAVTCRLIGTADYRTIHVLCPVHPNDALARASVMAPQAMALLGRRIGSIVEISLPFNPIQYVEIVDVRHMPWPLADAADVANARGFA